MKKQKPQPNLQADILVHSKLSWKPAVFLAFFAFLLYSNTIPFDYTLDDAGAVTNNAFVKKGLHGIPELLTTDFWHFDNVQLGYYRPLSLITLAVEVHFFGTDPHVSHCINAILYGISVLIILLLLQKVFREYNTMLAFSVALLFAAHPVHTEVVANIKSRDEILSLLNMSGALLFLILYMENKRVTPLIISLLFFYLSLLSKETSTVAILLIPVLIYFSGDKKFRKIAQVTLFFIGVASLFLIQKKIALGSLSGVIPKDLVNYPYSGMSEKMATMFLIFLRLEWLLIFPFSLRYDYSYNAIPAGDWQNPLTVAGIILFLYSLSLIVKNKNQGNIFGLGLAFLMITILPALAFILLRGGIMAERFLFAPSLGYCMVGVVLVSRITGTMVQSPGEGWLSFVKKNKTFTTIILLVSVLFSLKTITRNRVWKDNFTLFSTDVEVNPNSAQNHRHLGSEYINKATSENDSLKKHEYWVNGVSELKKAIKIYPVFGDAFFKLGVAYHSVYFNTDSAIYYYLKAIETAPGYSLSYNNLGIVYQYMKNYELASYYYNKAAEVNPNHPDGKKNAANLKAATGLDIHVFPTSINLDSLKQKTQNKDALYYYNLGTLYASKGDYKTAMENLKIATTMNPQYVDAFINLGNCYGLLKLYKESIDCNLRVLQLNPGNKSAWQNLMINYEQTGQKEKSDEARKKLTELTGQ